MDYKNIIEKEKKAIQLLELYFGIKKENISKENLFSFLNKFYIKIDNEFRSYDTQKNKEFILYFELKENEYNLYNSTICIIDNLLTIHAIKKQNKNMNNIRINFNDKDFNIQVKKRYSTYYLIVDNYIPLFFTTKENLLGNVSLNNGAFWYSYLSSTIQEYLGFKSMFDYEKLINQIKGA